MSWTMASRRSSNVSSPAVLTLPSARWRCQQCGDFNLFNGVSDAGSKADMSAGMEPCVLVLCSGWLLFEILCCRTSGKIHGDELAVQPWAETVTYASVSYPPLVSASSAALSICASIWRQETEMYGNIKRFVQVGRNDKRERARGTWAHRKTCTLADRRRDYQMMRCLRYVDGL